MKSKKTKICLIIDNPIRDLQGSVFLATRFSLKDIDVYLIPMYDQIFEIARIRPDLVILNYVRYTTLDLCKFYASLGIKVIVLDTEGAVFDDLKGDLIDRIPKDASNYVDLFLTWGKAQRDAIVEAGLFPKGRVFAVGCPRYDFCAKPWRQALENKMPGEEFVLFNMRYSLFFPRYMKDIVDEMSNTHNENDVPIHWCWRIINNMRGCCQLLEAVEYITAAFPDLRVVMRPHPFEREDVYKIIFHDMPNVTVIREGFSLEWINSALAVIQKECSTSIEAKLLGVPALSIDWFGDEFSGSSITYKAADTIRSPGELVDVIKKIRGGQYVSDATELDGMIGDFFGILDGKASDRVCEQVLQVLTVEKKQIVVSAAVWKMGIPKMIKAIIKKCMGKRIMRFFQALKGKPDNRSKYFDGKWVTRIMKNLEAVDPEVSKVKADKMLWGETIRLKRSNVLM